MTTTARASVLTLLVMCLPVAAAAQTTRAWNKPKPVLVGDHVKLVGGDDVLPWLVIDYPWTEHRDASLEVRLVTGRADASAGRTGPGKVQPMLFRAHWMHGRRLEVLVTRLRWINERNLPRIPVAERVTEPELVAWQNHFGRRAVGAVEHYGKKVEVAGGEAIPGVAISLPWLEQWSLGPGRLIVDLPAEEFAQPGWLRVWLVRGDQPVWRQDLPWPGGGRVKSEE